MSVMPMNISIPCANWSLSHRKLFTFLVRCRYSSACRFYILITIIHFPLNKKGHPFWDDLAVIGFGSRFLSLNYFLKIILGHRHHLVRRPGRHLEVSRRF
jgi:hypothetical protein